MLRFRESTPQEDKMHDSSQMNETPAEIPTERQEPTLPNLSQVPTLPDELQLHAFTYLPLQTLLSLQLANSSLHALLTYSHGAASLWRNYLDAYDTVLVPERDLEKQQGTQEGDHQATPQGWLHNKLYGTNKSIAHLKKLAWFVNDMHEFEESSYQDDVQFYHASVLGTHLQSSSFDARSQDISNTRSLSLDTFYSSTGSDTQDANEWLTYHLRNPVEQKSESDEQHEMQDIISDHKPTLGAILLKRLALRAFMAHWQENNIYPPKFVNIHVIDSENDKVLYQSETFPVENINELQVFELNPPVLILQRDPKAHDMTATDAHAADLPMLTFHHTDVTHADVTFAREQWDEQEEDVFIQLIVRSVLQRKRAALIRNQALRRQNSSLILKANLLGKVQTQPGDDLYYTCLNLFDVQGDRCLVKIDE